MINWEKLKNRLIFFLKSLEFKYQTWCRAREISRAYQEQHALRLPRFTVLKKYGYQIVVGSGALVLILVLGFGVWKLSSSAFFGKVRQTIVSLKPDPQARKAEQKARIKKLEKKAAAGIQKREISAMPLAAFPEPVAPQIDSAEMKAVHEAIKTDPYFIILAEKTRRQLYLMHFSEKEWQVRKIFNVAIGRDKGPKLSEGDRRTPEGQYFVVGRKEQSELGPMYGPLAYVLDYPNEHDRREGKTGQGIWIHGTERDAHLPPTRGCIALQNNELRELAGHLRIGIGTPVVIISDSLLVDPVAQINCVQLHNGRSRILKQQAAIKDAFAAMLVGWKSAWEQKDIDKYSEYYATSQFINDGAGWKQWRERKLRTFNLYSTIDISLDNVIVTDLSDSAAVVKFVQIYRSNINLMKNGKKLSLIKDGLKWKILRESSFAIEELLL